MFATTIQFEFRSSDTLVKWGNSCGNKRNLFVGKTENLSVGATCIFTLVFLGRNPSWGTKGLDKQQQKVAS